MSNPAPSSGARTGRELRYHSHMPHREYFRLLAKKARERAERTEKKLRTLHLSLLSRSRPYEVVSRALGNFWERKMYYSTTYFTYNAFLAVLALLAVFAAVLGFFARFGSQNLQGQLQDSLNNFLPILGGTSKSALEDLAKYRNIIGVIGFIALVWTSTKMFSALEWGFCEIIGCRRRSFVKGKLYGALMFAVIGAIFVSSFLIQYGFGALADWLFGKEHGDLYVMIRSIGSIVLCLLVNFLLFLFVYRVIPTVRQSMRSCCIGALIASMLFLGIQYALSFYFGKISSVPNVYGSISTAVVLIIWLHLTGMITYFGEDVVHVIEIDRAGEAHAPVPAEA